MKARYEQRRYKTGTGVSVTDYLDLANLPHWHTEHELVHIVSGSAEIMVNNTLYAITSGGSVFISSEDVHYIRSAEGSIVSVIKLDSDLLKPVAGRYTLASPIIENSYPVYEVSREIKRELEHNEKNCGIIADCLALKLAAEIFRSEKTLKRSELHDSSDTRYKELLRLISERYAFITFEEAAGFMCLSQPYFSKYFHRLSGMTFTRYLNIVKVSAASEMLSERKMSVTEIAAACGFGTIRSFNRVFRELTGTSPTSAAENTVTIRSEKAESGFDPTLSCTVQLSEIDLASLPERTV